MDEIEKNLTRARKMTESIRELADQIENDIPEKLDSYNDLDQVFDALGELDGTAQQIIEIRNELRDALVDRVRRAVKKR